MGLYDLLRNDPHQAETFCKLEDGEIVPYDSCVNIEYANENNYWTDKRVW